MNQKQSKKPFLISKRTLYSAWKEVKANRGSAGIDKVSINEYEQTLGAHNGSTAGFVMHHCA
jgi:hypothetical protein